MHADREPLVFGEPPRRPGIVQHIALDERHDVEGRVVHLGIAAQGNRLRHRHIGIPEPKDNLVLPAHVVGALQYMPERRPAQHPGGTRPIGEAVGQVGVSAGDQGKLQWRFQILETRREPLGDPLFVDAFHALVPSNPVESNVNLLNGWWEPPTGRHRPIRRGKRPE